MSNDKDKEPKPLKRGRTEEETPTLNEADVCRAIRKHELLSNYNLSVEEIKAVLEAYSAIIYRCMLNDIKICMPKLGWFKRKHKKGMSARKMSVPLHPFTEDKSYKMVEYPKQPDYSVIEFIVRKKVKDAFKEQTLGEDNGAY
jgi:nucleoid DNA-binding protein